MKFIGAAQQPFNSFMELARFMLDTHCHNWNNSSDHRSYILPPVFSFKNADMSDQDIEKIKMDLVQQKQAGVPENTLNSIQRSIIDRRSDYGEFEVFYALWKLIQDEVAPPFLAIHALNLDNVRQNLQHIFPHAQIDIQMKFEAMMGEYDFVLIGPKIGLIVIEVKSSSFTKKKDFAENNKHLPEDMVKALDKQLGSFDPSLFQVCSGIQMPQEIPVRKILFTPNLRKEQFETWINKLDAATRKQILNKFDGVIHWFSEDMDNKCDQKPLLYSTLQEEIEKNGYAIPHEIFESYGLIISGLRSTVVLRNQQTVSTNVDRLSTSSAILKDAAALESHNPKKQPLDENATNMVEIESKLVLLTPEQLKALNGPNKQFIIGAPGTGKSIILQVKIARLLNQGKKVLVFAEAPYNGKYTKLFGSHDFCKVRETNQRTSYFSQLTEVLKKSTSENGTLDIGESMENLPESILGASLVQDLRDFDAIFIDDAFDFDLPFLGPDWKFRRIYESYALMAITSSSKFPSKVVWVACDAFLNDSDDEFYKRILNQIIGGKLFTTAILNQVIRSSEIVFQAIYSTEVIQHLAKEPVIGHKIHGFYDSVHLCHFSLDDTLLEIWNRTYGAVKKFKEDGFGYEHMAIIIGGEQYVLHRYLWQNFFINRVPVARDSRSLTLDYWKRVSSFEWPVVIYIGMFESHEKRAYEAYIRYRACSRAIMNLFEITADIETDLTKVAFYGGDDGLYVLAVHNRLQNEYYNSLCMGVAVLKRGTLFESLAGWKFTIYKFDLKENPDLCKEILNLNLVSQTDDEGLEKFYLEQGKRAVPLSLDGLEYYCHRGQRDDLFEFIVKAKKT